VAPSAPGVQTACLRLTASRARLRLALHGPEPTAADDTAAASGWAGLMAFPALRVLRDAVRGWWTQHPWHTAGGVAAEAVNAALRPVACRHPWALAAAALLADQVAGRTAALDLSAFSLDRLR
jgi:hypothetical protein